MTSSSRSSPPRHQDHPSLRRASPTPRVKRDDCDKRPNRPKLSTDSFMHPTHILRARDTSATHPSAYDNSNGWANPPLPRYLATAHPTSITLTRSNEWVSEATCVVSAGHRRICHGCGVGFADPYRTRAESEVFLTPPAVSRSFVFTRRM